MNIVGADTLTTLSLTLAGVPDPFVAVLTHVSAQSDDATRLAIYDKNYKVVYHFECPEKPVPIIELMATLENWAYAIEINASNTNESNYYAEKSGL